MRAEIAATFVLAQVKFFELVNEFLRSEEDCSRDGMQKRKICAWKKY